VRVPSELDEAGEGLVGAQPRGIVRIGDTVRRPAGESTLFGEALLLHLEVAGFQGAPRFRGRDELDREILTFVAGEVAPEQPPVGTKRLESAARLIRRFHDATAASAVAEGEQVVCHGELGPHNTLFVGDDAVALIDFDTAYPGCRLDDLGHAAWFFVPIGHNGGPIAEQGRRLRLFCDAYGALSPEAVLVALAIRFERAAGWYRERGLAYGEAVFVRNAGWLSRWRETLLGAGRI
jgi:hypothetical protein